MLWSSHITIIALCYSVVLHVDCHFPRRLGMAGYGMDLQLIAQFSVMLPGGENGYFLDDVITSNPP